MIKFGCRLSLRKASVLRRRRTASDPMGAIVAGHGCLPNIMVKRVSDECRCFIGHYIGRKPALRMPLQLRLHIKVIRDRYKVARRRITTEANKCAGVAVIDGCIVDDPNI